MRSLGFRSESARWRAKIPSIAVPIVDGIGNFGCILNENDELADRAKHLQ